MIQYKIENLKRRISNIIENLEFLSGAIEEIDFKEIIDDYKCDNYDIVINEDSEVWIDICEDDYSITNIGSLLNMSENLKKSKLNKSQSCFQNEKESDFLLLIKDFNTAMFIKSIKIVNHL